MCLLFSREFRKYILFSFLPVKYINYLRTSGQQNLIISLCFGMFNLPNVFLKHFVFTFDKVFKLLDTYHVVVNYI